MQRLMAVHYDVSVPFCGITAYDMIVDTGSNLSKVQVRRAWFSERKGAYSVDMRRRHHVGEARAYDHLVVVAGTTCYVLPSELVAPFQGMLLRPPGCAARNPAGRRSNVTDLESYQERWDLITKGGSSGGY